MNENGGQIYIFEGIDNVGKSTVMDKVSEKLELKGYDISKYSFPGNEEGTLGGLVYDIHHEQGKYFKEELNPISLQILHIAAHIELLQKKLIPDLKNGKLILLDRFWWSTFCYGVVSGIDKEELNNLLIPELKYWENIHINKVFYLERKPSEQVITDEKKRLLDEYRKIVSNSQEYWFII